MTEGVEQVFTVSDGTEELTVKDHHDNETVLVSVNGEPPWVALTLEQVDALADSLRDIYYRRDRLAKADGVSS